MNKLITETKWGLAEKLTYYIEQDYKISCFYNITFKNFYLFYLNKLLYVYLYSCNKSKISK